MTQIDVLKSMLDEAEIPYEYHVVVSKFEHPGPKFEASKYTRNQIIYGRTGDHEWKFDAICQYGSRCSDQGLLETWGYLGVDEVGEPMTLTAETAFDIIRKDWKIAQNEKN